MWSVVLAVEMLILCFVRFIPLLVGQKNPWCFSWPGASSSSALPDKTDVVFHWWWTSLTFLSTPLQHLGQLSQDLIMVPSVAPLWKHGPLQSEQNSSFPNHWWRFQGQGSVSYVDLMEKLSLACGIFHKSNQLIFWSTTPSLVSPATQPWSCQINQSLFI